MYILLNIILALGTEIDHYCQEVMQFHCEYGYLCIEADNDESDTEIKKVIYTVKSYGATNTVEVEIENQKEAES